MVGLERISYRPRSTVQGAGSTDAVLIRSCCKENLTPLLLVCPAIRAWPLPAGTPMLLASRPNRRRSTDDAGSHSTTSIGASLKPSATSRAVVSASMRRE
jgi:hypothetical protein